MATTENLAETESAASLARRIRAREISPVEVMDAAIARIEAHNPTINALPLLYLDEARDRAKEAEAAVMRGDALAPLHGVPAGMKDLFNMKPGWRTTFGGVRALKDWVADTWSMYDRRVEEAGAILVGKTNVPVFGFRGTCDNPLFGPSKNPFDLSRNTGGSSGGSAGAVAAGLLPVCGGTDGGGSIRIPASWSGVYGFKPSFGRIPFNGRPNGFGGVNPFIFEGPLTRTVEDAALTVTATAGYDPVDPYAMPGRLDLMGALNESVAGKRIAYTRDYGIFPVEAEIVRVVDAAVKVFEEAGAHVEEVELGINRSQHELSDLWCRFIAGLQAAALDGFKAGGIDIARDHRDDMPAEVWYWDEISRRQTVPEFLDDQVMRTEIYDAINGVLDRYDFLVSPTLAALPVKNTDDGDTKGPTEINGEKIDPLIGWCMTYLINYTGNPAASVPAGFSADGLPVGMQIVGRQHDDVGVIAASATFERMRPWKESYRRLAL